ncbi:MAG: hypothetical protein VX202_04640 [Pseudomonadota bacterium]|nr:hypothetical protein [Pseudomonadota bacterium]
MKVSRTINHQAQYTALVDILFATIGVFVIVFALQDLDPPQDLQPAPYDHLILCDTADTVAYYGAGPDQPLTLNKDELRNGRLGTLIQSGRVLIAFGRDCLAQSQQGGLYRMLVDLEEELTERPATETSPLTLFEFAPLGTTHGTDALIQRFLLGSAS